MVAEEMTDLTVIYLTANEMPDKWVQFHRHVLEKAVGSFPVITMSRKPVDFGLNIVETDKKDYANIYRQLLVGAKRATTKYVGVAEDDTLYSEEHFRCFRPQDDEFAYNFSRWSLFTWPPILFSVRQRISNCSLIAPRALLIEALQERFDKYRNSDFPMQFMGECGRNNIERGLGITQRKAVTFYSRTPVVQLSHPNGTEDRQKRMRKKLGVHLAVEIPYWGRGSEIVKYYE